MITLAPTKVLANEVLQRTDGQTGITISTVLMHTPALNNFPLWGGA
jgi:hypothetical protein